MRLSHCDTYWGSHGCSLFQGHDGPCVCDCAFDKPEDDLDGGGNVGGPPYYGPETHFYGDDIPEQTRNAAIPSGA